MRRAAGAAERADRVESALGVEPAARPLRRRGPSSRSRCARSRASASACTSAPAAAATSWRVTSGSISGSPRMPASTTRTSTPASSRGRGGTRTRCPSCRASPRGRPSCCLVSRPSSWRTKLHDDVTTSTCRRSGGGSVRHVADGLRATGRCLCGAVTYEVRGPLRDIVLCHCVECRRWSGYRRGVRGDARRRTSSIGGRCASLDREPGQRSPRSAWLLRPSADRASSGRLPSSE